MVYLDNNATTKPTPEVVRAVAEALEEQWENPSSMHRAGQLARNQIELARRSVAEMLGTKPRFITFTSSGTESIDLAIRGCLATTDKRAVLTTRIEHSAVRELLAALARTGAVEVRHVDLDDDGVVRVDSLEEHLAAGDLGLVSIQWANNETGAIHPVEQIARACRSASVPYHCDGTQWVGKMPTRIGDPEDRRQPALDDPETGMFFGDYLSFSPHKFHGPKGVGVLWARAGTGFAPTIHGEQELGRRGGTENVPGIAGTRVACEQAMQWLADRPHRLVLARLRDRFEREVLSGAPGTSVNGPTDSPRRLWNTTNIAFEKMEAEALLLLLSERGLYASAGSACSSGSLEPSFVLRSMGIPAERAHGSVRFTLSRNTTDGDIDEAVRIVLSCAERLRKSSAAVDPG